MPRVEREVERKRAPINLEDLEVCCALARQRSNVEHFAMSHCWSGFESVVNLQ
jgi:hypothetical protein